MSSSKEQSPFAPESYDAVWSVALGLQKLQKKYNYSLENFNYMDDQFSHDLNEEIGHLNFTGISVCLTCVKIKSNSQTYCVNLIL